MPRQILSCACFIILLLFASPKLSPASSQKPERPAILAVLENQKAAWNRGDVDSFMNGYWRSPEVTFAGKTGFTRGWETVLARYQHAYPDKTSMGYLEFSDLEVRQLGPDSALVLGSWHIKRTAGDIGGIFTLVLQKFPEGWRIVHDHTTAN